MKISRKSKIQIGLLLLPGLLVFGIFTIYPILKLFIMSFFEWDFGSMLSHNFIGLENYKEVLQDEYFWTVFINSLLYTLVTVPGQMLVGFFVALLLNQITRFKVGYRVMYYLPVITSWVCVQYGRIAELFPHECSTYYQRKCKMAGYQMGRYDCCYVVGNMEGNRMEHGCIPGSITDSTDRSL